MKAYKLTKAQINHGGSKLADLAHECGYACLEDFINQSGWDNEVSELEDELQEQLTDLKSRSWYNGT